MPDTERIRSILSAAGIAPDFGLRGLPMKHRPPWNV